MVPDPRIRASDADRDRVAEALREHHATGRLTLEEFQDRLDRAYAAKTLGDLDELVSDLPAIDLYQLPIPAAQRPGALSVPAAGQHGRLSPMWKTAWAGWATVSMVCFVVWLLAGMGSPWFLWVAGPWGAVMAVRWIFGTAPHGRVHGRAGPRARE